MHAKQMILYIIDVMYKLYTIITLTNNRLKRQKVAQYITITEYAGGFAMKRLEIEAELLKLGAPAGRCGYAQMVSALEFIMQHEEIVSTTNSLYPYVAEQLNTRPPRVERNIREEINAIWSHGNQARLNELFVNRTPYPPGSKEFLYTLARRLKHEHCAKVRA